jgi:hypothetical protein
MVNKLDSFCHSINFIKKLEFIKIFIHQEMGKIQIIKSPHLPCGLNVVAIFGLNFNVLYLNTLDTIK